jgi:hypothetical protein
LTRQLLSQEWTCVLAFSEGKTNFSSAFEKNTPELATSQTKENEKKHMRIFVLF